MPVGGTHTDREEALAWPSFCGALSMNPDRQHPEDLGEMSEPSHPNGSISQTVLLRPRDWGCLAQAGTELRWASRGPSSVPSIMAYKALF